MSEHSAENAGIRFRVEVACDGYAALTTDEPFGDVPDEWADEADAYIAGAAAAAQAIRKVLRTPTASTPGEGTR